MTDHKDKFDQSKVYEELYPGEIDKGIVRLRAIKIIGIVSKVILLVFSLLLFFVGDLPLIGGDGGIPYYVLTFSIFVIFSALSIGYIPIVEIGFRTSFGKILDRKMREGLYYSPWGLTKVRRIPRGVLQVQFPGEPEDVQKTSDKEALRIVEMKIGNKIIAKARVRPVRVITHEDPESDSTDPLSSRIVSVASWVDRFRIEEPIFFFTEFGGDFEEVIKQLRDLGETIIGEQVSQRTAAQLVDELPSINAILHQKHQTRIEEGIVNVGNNKEVQRSPWGFVIEDSNFIPFDVGKDVAVALQTIVTAKAEARTIRTLANANADKTRITADADKYRLEKEGLGEGSKDASILAGEGRGLKRQAKSLNIKPSDALAAQVAKETVGEGDLILGSEGIAKAIGIGRTIFNSSKTSDASDAIEKGD